MVREEKLWRVCELVLFCFFPVKKKKKRSAAIAFITPLLWLRCTNVFLKTDSVATSLSCCEHCSNSDYGERQPGHICEFTFTRVTTLLALLLLMLPTCTIWFNCTFRVCAMMLFEWKSTKCYFTPCKRWSETSAIKLKWFYLFHVGIFYQRHHILSSL